MEKEKPIISGVVVTKNCCKELPDCLASLQGLVDEIVVVDLGSSDDTISVANHFKARVLTHEPVHYVELIRQYAISQARGEWVMVMDPDERVSPSLANRLKDLIPQSKIVAANISRKNIFFSRWVRHTNFWPDRQIRFFRKSCVSWNTQIHSYPEVKGEILDLPATEDLALIHYGYESYDEFYARQNRYSSVEAENLIKKRESFSYLKLFWKPMREVLVRLIKHAGFLDGFLGLSLVYSLAIYQLSVQIKLWEKTQKLHLS